MPSAGDVDIQISGDATRFVGAIGQAGRGLDQLDSQVRRTHGHVISFGGEGGALGLASKGAERFGAMALGATKAVIGFAKGAALAGAATATAFGGGALVAGMGRLEAIQDATVSLTKMLGSEKKAADLTAAALKVVKGTPFAFPDFAEATRQLVAYGMSAQKIPKVLLAIADSAAASGRGSEAVSGLTYAFSQLQAAGKLNMGLVNQISGYGVSAIGILGNAYGKSTADMQKMISSGKVSADKAIAALTNGIENGSKGINGQFNALKGSAQDLGKTLSGSFGNAKAAFARMGASWLKPFEKDLPDVINKGVIPTLDKLGDIGGKLGDKFAKTGAFEKLTVLLQKVPGVAQKAIDKFNEFWPKIKTVVDQGADFVRKWAPLVELVVKTAGALSPVNVLFDALKGILPQLLGPLGTIGKDVAQTLVPALVAAATALVPLIPAVSSLASTFAHGLAQALPGVVSMIQGLTPVVVTLAGVVTGLPQPILTVVSALVGLQAAGVPVGSMIGDLFEKVQMLHDGFGHLAEVGQNVQDFASQASNIQEFGAAAEGVTGKVGGVLESVGKVGSFLTGPWGLAIGVGVAGLGLLATAMLDKGIANADQLATSLDKATGKITAMSRASATQELAKKDDKYGMSAFDVAKSLGIDLKTATDAALGYKGAQDKVNAAVTAARQPFLDAEKAAGSNTTKFQLAQQQLAKFDITTGILTRSTRDQSAALKKAAQDAKDMAAANDEASKKGADYNTKVADAIRLAQGQTDGFNDMTVAGHANVTMFDGLIKQGSDWIASMKFQGVGAAEVSGKAKDIATSLMATAEAYTGTKQKALDYVMAQKGIPTEVKTDIVENALEAGLKVDKYAGFINSLPTEQKIALLNTAAEAGVDVSKYASKIDGIPPEWWTKFELETQAAEKHAKDVQHVIDSIKQGKPPALAVDALKGKVSADDLQKAIDKIKQGKEPGVKADTKEGKALIKGLQAAIDAIHQGKVPSIKVNTGLAENAVANIQSQLDNMHGKTVNVKINRIGAPAVEAMGGIREKGVQAFAAGGIANRDGMMARGGANILWAEPETGWEAYISGKAGASARNRAVWAEAGKRLGMLGKDGATAGGGSSTNVTLNVTQQEAGDSWMDAAVHKLRFALG